MLADHKDGLSSSSFSLNLDISVGLSAGIQSAGDSVPETLWVRILHSAKVDNLYPFDSKIDCLCQSRIEINNKKHVCMYACHAYIHTCMCLQWLQTILILFCFELCNVYRKFWYLYEIFHYALSPKRSYERLQSLLLLPLFTLYLYQSCRIMYSWLLWDTHFVKCRQPMVTYIATSPQTF